MKAQGELNPEQEEQVQHIIAASRRLSNLITNILKLSRLEKQNIQPEAKVYDVCEQICECVLQFENRWEEKKIELDIDMEERIFVRADESLMELVWNNLMSNAIKFTDSCGHIRIQETVRHIFDKFYQGDTSHATEGNGLGLALVYRILQLSDASISVESEENKGTTFVVTMAKAGKAGEE